MMLEIESGHLIVIKKILKEIIKDVRAFGSRTKGNARELSDLDLIIMVPVSTTVLTKLRDQFEESNLPFKVDLIVWDEISDAFREHIKPDLIPL